MQQDHIFPSQDPASPSAQPGLVLPSPSIQNHIHELAKTLPPPRKQNTACDACRSRKVKCNRLPGQDKCQHCLSKNYPCTHFVQQATSEKKRSGASVGRRRNISSTNPHSSSPGPQKLASPNPEYSAVISPPPYIPNGLGNGVVVNESHSLPLVVKYGFAPLINLTTPTRDVLSYIFAPPENASDSTPFSPNRVSPYDAWGDLASKLEDDKFKAEFALDLVEVFFQIVHTRLPLLNPAQFRNRLQLQSSAIPTNDKPLHPALVATVLAWGTKFSEHPLLVADRRRPGGQSLLAKILIDRARDLAEALKVHRIPSADHVVIALLIEPLQNQNPDDANGFHGFWLTSATRHLLDLGVRVSSSLLMPLSSSLADAPEGAVEGGERMANACLACLHDCLLRIGQINHKSVMANIQDPESRGTMIFAWWMTCICDAYASAYYRKKPVLDDDDYDIDFYTVDPINHEMGDSHSPIPSPREQLEFLGYYRAAHSLARTARQMSRQLWRPATDADGVPFDVLSTISAALTEWRDEFLNLVGVPSNFEGEWDFVSAVSSCASDATYHVMWIILFNALDDYGVKEINHSLPASHEQIDATKRRVADEALHGALRIAGLAGVLTSNGYLRLDPAVMHVSCIQAGTLLARLGRPEVTNCIAGLEQYSHSYEEAGDQASEMRRLYNSVRGKQPELNHMASVTPRVNHTPQPTPPPASHPMLVDDQYMGTNGSPNPFTPADTFSSIYGR